VEVLDVLPDKLAFDALLRADTGVRLVVDFPFVALEVPVREEVVFAFADVDLDDLLPEAEVDLRPETFFLVDFGVAILNRDFEGLSIH
jgi:hypothetical protein